MAKKTRRERFPITPVFFVEVDHSLFSLLPHGMSSLTETIGQTAKYLHVTLSVNEMFVYKGRRGYYASDNATDRLVATLTTMTDNRVSVDYQDGRPQEILYL